MNNKIMRNKYHLDNNNNNSNNANNDNNLIKEALKNSQDSKIQNRNTDLKRKDALENIMKSIDNELIISNIGFPSRELYDIKDRDETFYMIGSMGLVSSIGLGLALTCDKKIVIIDGDGAFLMNMGSIVTTIKQNPKNLTWIVINNGAYGSTGNQETYAKDMDLIKIAESVGFNSYNFDDINLKEIINKKECSFISYSVGPGNDKASIIPYSPIEIKNRFMKKVLE